MNMTNSKVFRLYAAGSEAPSLDELKTKTVFALTLPGGSEHHYSDGRAPSVSLRAWADPIVIAGPAVIPKGHLTVLAVSDSSDTPPGFFLVSCKAAWILPPSVRPYDKDTVLMIVYQTRESVTHAVLVKKLFTVTSGSSWLAVDFDGSPVPDISANRVTISLVMVPAKVLGLPETEIVELESSDSQLISIGTEDIARTSSGMTGRLGISTNPYLIQRAISEGKRDLLSTFGTNRDFGFDQSGLVSERASAASFLGSVRLASISHALLDGTPSPLIPDTQEKLQDLIDFLSSRSDVSQKPGAVSVIQSVNKLSLDISIALKTKTFHDVATGRKYKVVPPISAHVGIYISDISLCVSVPKRSRLFDLTREPYFASNALVRRCRTGALRFLTPVLTTGISGYIIPGRTVLTPIFGPALKTVLRTVQESDLKGLTSALLDRIRFVSDTDPTYKLLPFWKEHIKT